MKAIVLLADSAQTGPRGKVHALGLGWNATVTPTPPQALIVFVDVGWDETNMTYPFHAELVDADGNPVMTSSPVGEDDQPLAFDGEIEADRTPGALPGTPVRIPVSIQIGPGMNLTAGHRYEWRITINGETHEDWSASFTVMDDQEQQEE